MVYLSDDFFFKNLFDTDGNFFFVSLLVSEVWGDCEDIGHLGPDSQRFLSKNSYFSTTFVVKYEFWPWVCLNFLISKLYHRYWFIVKKILKIIFVLIFSVYILQNSKVDYYVHKYVSRFKNIQMLSLDLDIRYMSHI